MYCSLDIIRATTSRKIIWAGHVTRIRKKRMYIGFMVKVKFTLQQTTKAHRGDLRYSSILSLISVLLDGGGG